MAKQRAEAWRGKTAVGSTSLAGGGEAGEAGQAGQAREAEVAGEAGQEREFGDEAGCSERAGLAFDSVLCEHMALMTTAMAHADAREARGWVTLILTPITPNPIPNPLTLTLTLTPSRRAVGAAARQRRAVILKVRVRGRVLTMAAAATAARGVAAARGAAARVRATPRAALLRSYRPYICRGF